MSLNVSNDSSKHKLINNYDGGKLRREHGVSRLSFTENNLVISAVHFMIAQKETVARVQH